MDNVLLDGRADSDPVYKRVIRTCWWESMDSIQHDLSGEFRAVFRMSRSKFNALVDIVTERWPAVHGEHSALCSDFYPGGIRRKVAIAIHFLSIESGIRVTANQFGVSVAAAWQCCKQFIEVIMHDTSQFIKLRTDFDMVADEFEAIAGFEYWLLSNEHDSIIDCTGVT